MAECVSRAGMAPMELRTNLSIVLWTVFQFPRWIKICPISVRYVRTFLLGTVTLLIANSAEHAPVSRGDATLTAKQLAAVFIVLKSLTGHHQPALLRTHVVVDLIPTEQNSLIHVQNRDALALLDVPDTLVPRSSI